LITSNYSKCTFNAHISVFLEDTFQLLNANFETTDEIEKFSVLILNIKSKYNVGTSFQC